MKTYEAPTEAHLETYIWTHPEALGVIYGAPVFAPAFRQYRLMSGIADLLGAYFWQFMGVCEIKKGDIDTHALAQVLRYMREIETVYETAQVQWNGACPSASVFISGILIGYRVPDANLLIACEAANIAVYTYQYLNQKYLFRSECSPISVERRNDYYRCHAPSPLSHYIKNLMSLHSEK